MTTLREFILIGRGPGGEAVELERYTLASDEDAFWAAASQPRRTVEVHGERLTEFLKRVMLYRAPLCSPEDVAFFLASYARDARARIDAEESYLPAFTNLRKTLEQGLGLTFTGPKGEHFFRSTLVQTLFYGLFSAWVLWRRGLPTGASTTFDRHLAAEYLHVPVLRKLFYEIAEPGAMKKLRLTEVLDLAAVALSRVRWEEFRGRFDDADAIQYFYEPFLDAFDPELRKDLGVWYTPREIVTYMVERVDRVLRTDLGIEDGLADPRVLVLDPCCGTGAYVVEVLRVIARTLKQAGAGGLLGAKLKKAAIDQVFGFEVLPAPYVIAHWQVTALLRDLGVTLSDDERAGVFLTNALTGWDPPKGVRALLPFTEFETERESARAIKHDRRILVVLGNPPYNAFAGTSPDEEMGLVEPYKEGLNTTWGIKKFQLDDLYVRFFRLAERRVAEMTGEGVVAYVSNFSYLADPSFVVMRQRLLGEFDRVWIDCLNGDSRETGKRTPDGKPDPSVFSTDRNREGIQLGTAIGMFVRRSVRDKEPTVRYREFWGVTKRADLMASLEPGASGTDYEVASPTRANRYSFRPSVVSTAYMTWPRVVDLCAEAPISGLQEMRRGALMDVSREALEGRMRRYFNKSLDWATFQVAGGALAEPAGRFDPKVCRERLLRSEAFDSERLLRYALYPLDNRWAYYTAVRPVWNEPRPALVEQQWADNRFFITRMLAERPNERVVMAMTRALPDYHLLRPNAVAIPIRYRSGGDDGQLFASQAAERANLSKAARKYLLSLGLPDPDKDVATSALLWMHALAVGYSPAYLTENAGGIRQDFPRVPLPASREQLEASACHGRLLADLLDTEVAVPGVTKGAIRPDLVGIAVPTRVDGKGLDPAAGDLDVTAGWGHPGRHGICMPGRGKLTRQDGTLAVWLNDTTCLADVPEAVWDYTIGGYQVLKKWLSYRDRSILGRALLPEEVEQFQHAARRLAAIVALEPSLDDNYRSCAETATGAEPQAVPDAPSAE